MSTEHTRRRLAPTPDLQQIAPRFWAKTRPDGDCLRWLGAVSDRGYGNFSFVADGRHVTIAAHRVAFLLANGALPATGVLMHSCDHKWCVNAVHLSAGTARENMRDAIDRLGHRNWNAHKTQCKRGHAFDEANTYFVPSKPGHRQCKACARDRQRQYRAGGVS